MKILKVIAGTGLALSLGALSPAFASMPQMANNQSNSPSASTAYQKETNGTAQKGEASEVTPGVEESNSGAKESTGAGGVQLSAESLSQQQSRIARQIHRLDNDLNDAQSYEAQGRQELTNGDLSSARRDFQTSEHILRMANGGQNFQAAYLGESPRQEQALVEKEIKKAEAKGVDVSNAKYFCEQGKDALDKGEQFAASRDFRAAALALGVPVEVGFAEVWEAPVPASSQQSMSSNNQGIMSKDREIKNEISAAKNNNEDVTDAQYFETDAEQAFDKGNEQRAERDLRAAQRALDENSAQNSNSSESSSTETAPSTSNMNSAQTASSGDQANR